MPPARSGRSSPSRPFSRASTASPGTSGCRCPTGRRSRSSRRATTTIPTRSPSSATPRRISWPRPCAGCIPGVKVAIGPAIDNGFYYDFEFPEPIREEDLAAIEAEIVREIGEGRVWTREAIGRDAARSRFEAEGEPYKVELVDTAEGDISLYTQGDFTDLCRGPHLQDSSPIKAVKLTGLAGAYWRGDEKNTQLTRIYGTAFFSQADLDAYLERLEQARANDHRRLGQQLDLFHFDEHSPGSPFWHPKGMTLINVLEDVRRRENAQTRLLGGQDADHLRQVALGDLGPLGEVPREHVPDPDRRAAPVRDEADELPGAHAALPVAALELPRPPGALRRGWAAPPERAGGHPPRPHARPVRDAGRRAHLLHAGPDRRRARRRDGVPALPLRPVRHRAAGGALDAARQQARLRRRVGLHGGQAGRGSRPATRSSTSSARARGRSTGRRSTLHATDSLGRSWQLGTIQLDAQMPARFGLTYMGADNREHPVFVIHRAFYGSFERFVGLVLEHYAGALPTWLSPVQVRVLPVARAHAEAAARARRRALARGCARGRRRVATRPSASGSATPSCRRSRTWSCGATARHARRWRSDERGVEAIETMSLDALVDEIAATSPTV